MKIFYFTDISLNLKSAQTVHVTQVCHNMAKQGNEVKLFVPRTKVRLSPPIYKVTYVATLPIAFSFVYQLLLLPKVFTVMRKTPPDVIYVRHGLLLFVPALLAWWYKVPLVSEVNGILIKEAVDRDTTMVGTLLRKLGVFYMLETVNFKVASKIICVAPAIKEAIIADHGISDEKVIMIKNGVDTEMFRPLSAAHIREKFGFTEQTFCVGYVGSFFRWQGLHFVVAAAKQLVLTHPDIKFMLVGDGDERVALQEFVESESLGDTVHLVPPVTHTDVPLYINAFDVCLGVPTRFREGNTSPFKVYEYLACGKPVIVTDIAGIREEFTDAVLYIEPESAEALAEAIVALSNNKEQQTDLSMKARNFVAGGVSWAAVTERVLEQCRSAIKSK